jgi:hypothetical protein
VPVLTHLIDQHFGDLQPDQSIRVELNFGEFTTDVVHFFFGLIYHNKLEHALAKSPEMTRQFEENVIQLHQLASYFGFAALIDICLARLYRLFSLDTVNHISAYCLQPLGSERGGHYYVPGEKDRLYTKLLHWYQLCIDDAAPDVLFQGAAPISPRRNSRASSANKTIVIGQKTRLVEGFARYLLPPSGVTSTANRDSLVHYQRVCTECICTPRLTHRKETAVINMGSPSNNWSLSMTHRIGDNRNMMLFLKYRSTQEHAGEDQMSVESSSSSHEGVRIQSRVKLFSQSLIDEGEQGEQLETTSNLGELTRIANVVLHRPEDCYEGLCDCCHRSESSVFIFCLSITVDR